MTIDILTACGCAYLALQKLSWKGEMPQGTTGALKQVSGTYRIGDFVKYNTTTNDWERVGTGDTIGATDRVAIIKSLKHYKNGSIYNEVDANGGQFKNAVLWQNGGNVNILAETCYLWNGSARVAFNPETHTSLAAKLQIHPFNTIDSGEKYYFSFD